MEKNEIKEIYDLSANGDARKSFYGKAKVIKYKNGDIALQSYNTIVAAILHNKLQIYGWFSSTTARHINAFLYQHGFCKMTKQEMEAF